MSMKYIDVCEQNEYLQQFKELSKTIENHLQTLNSKNEEIASLRATVDNLELKVSMYKQQFDNKLSDYQRTLMMLRQQKEKVEHLNSRIYELEYELGKVGVRAAVAFNELTPRYDRFEEEFKQLKIKKPFEKITWEKTSTKDFIEHLLTTVKELQQKNKELAMRKISQKKMPQLETEFIDGSGSGTGSGGQNTPFRNISPKSESRFALKSGRAAISRDRGSSFMEKNRINLIQTGRSYSVDRDSDQFNIDEIIIHSKTGLLN